MTRLHDNELTSGSMYLLYIPTVERKEMIIFSVDGPKINVIDRILITRDLNNNFSKIAGYANYTVHILSERVGSDMFANLCFSQSSMFELTSLESNKILIETI